MVSVRPLPALFRLLFSGAMLLAPLVPAFSAPDDIPRAVPLKGEVDPAIGPELPPEEKKVDASLMTRTEARTLALKVPAPRGQITDRTGVALAQNRVAHYLALKLPYREGQSETDMLRYARQRVALAYRILGEKFTIPDSEILSHYKNRRWLPLSFAPLLDEEQIAKIKPQLDPGLVLFPVYMRTYPLGSVAPHVIGYVGTKQKVQSKFPVASGDPLWDTTEGRSGLEVAFDGDLEGTMGEVNLLFDANGTQLAEEMVKRPVPGHNVITTLDAEMQATAERLLKSTGRNGAFVVLDAQNGDVYALASWPNYDLNDWIPLMTEGRYKELMEDPATPMSARAYQGLYPPASSFKLPVALAALESGSITENDYFGCPAGMQIGNLWKKNWNKNGEGSMNVVDAIKRSCSTWFYTVGMKTGADNISAMAHKLGLGEKTGLPLPENSGVIPDSAWAESKGIRLYGGHVANIAIGQGDVLCTPVQIARMAAAIGNGSVIPRTRLVQQIQDVSGRVLQVFPSEIQSTLVVDQHNLDLVRQGMIAVVNGSGGTARSARNDYVTMAGKTGTGEWSEKERTRLAWFAGFVPAEAPRFAFAVVIEGKPGETIGGGAVAAPLIGEMFNAFYKKEKEGGRLDDYVKAKIADSSGSGTRVDHDGGSSRRKETASNQTPEPPTQPITEAPKKKNFFQRLGIGKKKR